MKLFGKPTAEELISQIMRDSHKVVDRSDPSERYFMRRQYVIVTSAFAFAVWVAIRYPYADDEGRAHYAGDWMTLAYEQFLAGLPFSEVQAVTKHHRKREQWDQLFHQACAVAFFAVTKEIDVEKKRPVRTYESIDSEGFHTNLMAENPMGFEDPNGVWRDPFFPSWKSPSLEPIVLGRAIRDHTRTVLFRGVAD